MAAAPSPSVVVIEDKDEPAGYSAFNDAVAILTLSAPLNNRFGVEVVDDLDNAIDELTAKEARAVLLCADGPDFSHGGDSEPDSNLVWG